MASIQQAVKVKVCLVEMFWRPIHTFRGGRMNGKKKGGHHLHFLAAATIAYDTCMFPRIMTEMFMSFGFNSSLWDLNTLRCIRPNLWSRQICTVKGWPYVWATDNSRIIGTANVPMYA
jgi:hypothetical protein